MFLFKYLVGVVNSKTKKMYKTGIYLINLTIKNT